MIETRPLIIVDKNQVPSEARKQIRKAGYIVAAVDDIHAMRMVPTGEPDCLLTSQDLITVCMDMASKTEQAYLSGRERFRRAVSEKVTLNYQAAMKELDEEADND